MKLKTASNLCNEEEKFSLVRHQEKWSIEDWKNSYKLTSQNFNCFMEMTEKTI